MRNADLTSRDIASLSSTTELMEREWAPCRYHCPVHADVRTYIECVAEGRWQAAIDVIRENLALAAVCGRICHHPCEANCRRKDVDEAIAIREVKRFVAEKQGAAGSTVRKPAVQDKARVAVVGAGPAGLAAALELARKGYRLTIFEKFPVAGGVCATAIPKYRMPRDVLQMDVDWVLAHGVELVTGVQIGKDKTIVDLKADGFEAVLIAAGLANSRMLDLPGSDHERVHAVLKFLTALAFDEKIDVGQDVLVIGGGNVACDAARSAIRLGAGRVRMMCLEDADQMPAWDWEVTEAKEEGIEIVHRRGPVEIKIADGKMVGLTARKVTRVFDEQDRFDPQYDDSDVIDLECDTVIMAIGQAPDMNFVEGGGLELDARGRLIYDAATQQTSQPYIFACGEIVTPPGSAVEACASGKRVAQAIDMYLAGQEIRIDDELPPHIDVIDEGTAETVIKVDREPVEAVAPDKRRTNCDQIDRNYAVAQALTEARRCMSCGAGAEVMIDKCAACLTCVRICPFDIPQVTDVARIASDKCQACGMCIAACPANAIVPRGREPKGLMARTAEVLQAEPDRRTVAYICGYHASAEQWRGECEASDGVTEIYLPSLARLSTTELLAAFENGADAVFVVACPADRDRYPDVAKRIRQRVAYTRQLLGEVGIDPQCLRLFEVADSGAEAVHAALAEAAAVSSENLERV